MAKEQEKKPEIVYSPTIRRIFFNRFKFVRDNGMMCVRVWYQDEMTRICNAYAFLYSDEDFAQTKANIKSYIQKVMQAVQVKSGKEFNSETCPADFKTIDHVRVMMCSRSGHRSEVYLGFFPLVRNIPGNEVEASRDIIMDVALCSGLDCHISLLRKIVEA